MLEAASKVEARRARLGAIEQELGHLRRLADELEAQIGKDRAALARLGDERVELVRELDQLAAQAEAARTRESELDAADRRNARCVRGARKAPYRRCAATWPRRARGPRRSSATRWSVRSDANARARWPESSGAASRRNFTPTSPRSRTNLTTALADRDAVADEARLVELRAKAERLGEVNLAAESEVKELEERSGVLTTERTDLEAAVNDLTHTIQKLNREARRRFSETFEGAARNFAELFPKLLRGGKGRLELLPADDVLEAGVNILVQPPGKKVKEIGLLSGGEKALCAMALIFSLFLLNPSPFCVMDEVDAPLDEFSLAAFTRLVGELKGRSQFIVITHNQRTMQRADHIHGVTMERPGISRLISLAIPHAA